MLNQETLSLAQSLLVSGVGMIVVVAELSVLAVSIKIFTYFISLFSKDNPEKVQENISALPAEEENFAVLLAIMKEELNSRNERYRVTSIRSI